MRKENCEIYYIKLKKILLSKKGENQRKKDIKYT